jgi:hypothetical protein
MPAASSSYKQGKYDVIQPPLVDGGIHRRIDFVAAAVVDGLMRVGSRYRGPRKASVRPRPTTRETEHHNNRHFHRARISGEGPRGHAAMADRHTTQSRLT